MGQSWGINNDNFMTECSVVDFLPKSGQAYLCHLVNTHNVVTYEAFNESFHWEIITLIVSLTRNVDTYNQEVYDENSSGHFFPIRCAQKLGWTLISLDGFYIQPW